ncbi:hypothetical protein P7C73_g1505, partial [Tremellales sp. Uapishka_1]
MSYAAVASHNIPAGEMPEPDQGLLAGHFDGETVAHDDIDHQLNVLPAGEDPHHPHVQPHVAPAPEKIVFHPTETPEPSVSDAAPKPLPTPAKHSVKLPESGADFDKKKEEVKDSAAKVEKKAEKGLDKAEKSAKENLGKAEKSAKENLEKAEKKGKEIGKKANAELHKAEDALAPYWEKTKDVVLRPGTLGGLMGVVNVGLLGTLGYFAYTRKDQVWDRRIVAGAVAGTLALFGGEGYVADSYLSTPEGRQEAERAKKEGSKFWLQTKETVLRPGVAGGLVGAVNVAILSTVGYFSYKHWNQVWDRRVVSAVSVGLVGLSGLEGWAGKVYADKELPKH